MYIQWMASDDKYVTLIVINQRELNAVDNAYERDEF